MSATRTFACGAVLALGVALVSSPHAAWAHDPTPVTVTNPVTVANPSDPTAFAKAQNTIRHPFLLTLQCDFVGVDCKATFDFSTTNPSQAILVEDASGNCIAISGTPLLSTQLNALTGTLFLPIVDHLGAPAGTHNFIPFGQVVHLSLTANQAVEFLTQVSSTTAGTSCFLSLSGEAIDQ